MKDTFLVQNIISKLQLIVVTSVW